MRWGRAVIMWGMIFIIVWSGRRVPRVSVSIQRIQWDQTQVSGARADSSRRLRRLRSQRVSPSGHSLPVPALAPPHNVNMSNVSIWSLAVMMARLRLVVMSLATLELSLPGETPGARGCQFPGAWRGAWHHLGHDEPLNVTADHIDTKVRGHSPWQIS